MREQELKDARVGALSNKASEFLERGDARGAAQVYEEAIQLKPSHPKLHYNLSLALNKLGDRVQEKKTLERAIELDPNFALAHNRLGLLYLTQAKSAGAEREFQSALGIDP